ncbi:MAG: hypothetical protein ABIF85_02280 [Nanoarchaeota archaeon]|nr:hypothetical protein [Nanoarchaeota archaeon]MBU4451353.1 hypothetical protein [Nanoarchaeota archaeon]MCG2723756.1 hypothetical protein [archaeon]
MFARRTGASEIIGAMLTFAIGVAILGGVVLIFSVMQSNVLRDIRLPQSMEVLNYVAASSTNLVRINASSSYVMLTLPRKIGDLDYIITGNENGDKIMLISSEISANVSSPAPFRGFFESNYEKVRIQYDAGNISIRGVSN